MHAYYGLTLLVMYQFRGNLAESVVIIYTLITLLYDLYYRTVNSR